MLELDCQRDTDDFMLIKGSKQLLDQFSRHYGHPLRNSQGHLISDRTNRLVSMALVLAFALLFLVSLFASIWADQGVQSIWIGYRVFATLTMYDHRFKDKDFFGSTEMALAEELRKRKKVALVDDAGRGVVASLRCWAYDSVAEGQEKIKELLREWE